MLFEFYSELIRILRAAECGEQFRNFWLTLSAFSRFINRYRVFNSFLFDEKWYEISNIYFCPAKLIEKVKYSLSKSISLIFNSVPYFSSKSLRNCPDIKKIISAEKKMVELIVLIYLEIIPLQKVLYLNTKVGEAHKINWGSESYLNPYKIIKIYRLFY